jgi:hypothetical protein
MRVREVTVISKGNKNVCKTLDREIIFTLYLR